MNVKAGSLNIAVMRLPFDCIPTFIQLTFDPLWIYYTKYLILLYSSQNIQEVCLFEGVCLLIFVNLSRMYIYLEGYIYLEV